MPSYVQCRSSDVNDTRLPNTGASAAMTSASSSFSAATPKSVTTHTTSPCHPSSMHQGYTNGAYELVRFNDVSDTRLPNAGASVAMPSTPSSVPATKEHIHTQKRYNPLYVAHLQCTRLPVALRSDHNSRLRTV